MTSLHAGWVRRGSAWLLPQAALARTRALASIAATGFAISVSLGAAAPALAEEGTSAAESGQEATVSDGGGASTDVPVAEDPAVTAGATSAGPETAGTPAAAPSAGSPATPVAGTTVTNPSSGPTAEPGATATRETASGAESAGEPAAPDEPAGSDGESVDSGTQDGSAQPSPEPTDTTAEPTPGEDSEEPPPGPTTQEPGPTTQEPEPTTQEPEPTTQEPEPTTQEPGPTTQEPVTPTPTHPTTAQPTAESAGPPPSDADGQDRDVIPATTSRPAATVLSVPPPTDSVAVLPARTGWANPAGGRLTSPFGPRVHPVLGIAGLHTGQDIATACGSPVYAAAAGRVVWAAGALQGRTGNQLVIAHGDGVVTRYGHLLSGSFEVKAGDEVGAGQRIASVGGDADVDPFGAGNSTGCHLHLEVNTHNGLVAVDPMAWFAARGIALGVDEPGLVRGAEEALVDVGLVTAEAEAGAAAEVEAERPTFEELAAGLESTFEAQRVPLTRLIG